MAAGPHRFFTDDTYTADTGVKEIAGPPWTPDLLAEFRFTYDILECALPEVRAGGLRFYVTKDAYKLPEYGPDVVAVLLQEERSKLPVYGRHVRAVLRNLHSKPFLGFRPNSRMGKLEAVLTFEYTRDWYTHNKSKRALNSPHPEWPAPVHKEPVLIELPLGYHSQVELPQIPMAERPLDMFFAGEIRHAVPKNDYRYWVSTSKFVARGELFGVLTEMQKKGAWNIDLGTASAGEQKAGRREFNNYSEKMMNSRICLAPRGTMAETYRAYEGLRAGCMVIGQVVPPECPLADAPITLVNHWQELEPLVKRYARNLDYLEEQRAKSLAFYEQRLKPEHFAPQVVKALNSL